MSLISDPDPGAAPIKGLGLVCSTGGLSPNTDCFHPSPGRRETRGGGDYQSSLTSAVLNHANQSGRETV